MKSRDKMIRAMTSGLRSDFPVVVPYLGIFLRDHWDEITNQPWWVIYDLDLSARLKVEEDLQSKLDLDWVPCKMCPPRAWRERHIIEVQDNSVFLVNTLNGGRTELRREPIGGSYIPYISQEPIIKSVKDVDEYIDVMSKEDLIRSGRLDYAKMVVERFGSKKFVFASISTPYWAAMRYFGFKGMIINLFKMPTLARYLIEKILERSLEEIKAYAEVGVDGIWIEECLASASEISPDQFKHFVLPYNEELISEIRRLGMRSIYYPCGDVRDRLELIIEAGPDCISLEESKKGFEIDIAWVSEVAAGRVCIFGNLDSIKVLQNGTTIELRREIRRQIAIGRKHGRFVMSIGSPVTPRTPTSRVKEYIEIARQESKI